MLVIGLCISIGAQGPIGYVGREASKGLLRPWLCNYWVTLIIGMCHKKVKRGVEGWYGVLYVVC